MSWNEARPPVAILPNNPATLPAESFVPISAAEAPGGDLYYFGRYYNSANTINECGYQKYTGTWSSYVKVDGSPDIGFGAALGDDVFTMAMAVNEDGRVLFVYGGDSGNHMLNAKLLEPGGSLGARITYANDVNQGSSSLLSVVAIPGGLFTVLCFRSSTSDIILIDFNPDTGTWTNERTIYDRGTDPPDWEVLCINNNSLAYSQIDGSYHIVLDVRRGHFSTTIPEVLYLKVVGSSVVSQQYITGSATALTPYRQPQVGVAPLTGKAFMIYKNDFPSSKSTVVLRETISGTTWGGEQLVCKDDQHSASLAGQNRANLVVAGDGSVHILYQDTAEINTWDRWYRSKPVNGALTAPDRVFEGTSEGDYSSAYQSSLLNQPSESSEGALYAFSMRQGHFEVTPFTTWWNVNPDALASAPRSYGTCIDVHKLAGVSPTAYRVHAGEVALFGGSPAVDGDTYIAASGAPGQLFIDTSYRMNDAGRIKAWTISQVNAAISYPIDMVSVVLVILYKSGSNYVVRAVSPMNRNLPRTGQFEFTCDLQVQKGDYLGVWMSSSPAVQIQANTELDSAVNYLVEFTAAAIPTAGQNMGAGSASATARTVHLFARGEVINPVQILLGRVSSASGEDAYGYYDFVSGTDAFPDAGIVTPANLFDVDKTTQARNNIGASAYVYYFLPLSAGLVAVESIAITKATTGVDGAVDVHVSQVMTVSADLAGAQSIAEADWKHVGTFDNALIIDDHVIHVARRCKWVRLKLSSTTAITRAGALEIKVASQAAAGGSFAVHPTSGVKTRIWIDASGHRWAPQRSRISAVAVSALDRFILFSGIDAEFIAQFTPGDRVYLDGTTGRGADPLIKVGVVRSAVLDEGSGTMYIELVSGIGVDFPSPPVVSPPPLAIQARAVNAVGQVIGATPWIPTVGVYQQWSRKHDVFSAGA